MIAFSYNFLKHLIKFDIYRFLLFLLVFLYLLYTIFLYHL